MDSMYDTVLWLPLFKGISKTQLSDFVAKTPLHFTTHNTGDLVVDFNEECNSVKALVSGSLRVTHRLMNGAAEVSYTLAAPAMICLHNLFGIETISPLRATSIGSAGIMEFEKSRLLDLLRSNSICLINTLNYLSWRAQRNQLTLQSVSTSDSASRLAFMILSVTENKSSEILLSSVDRSVYSLLCTSDADRFALERMEQQGVIKIKSDTRIEIPSHAAIRDFIQK